MDKQVIKSGADRVTVGAGVVVVQVKGQAPATYHFCEQTRLEVAQGIAELINANEEVAYFIECAIRHAVTKA